MKDGQDKTLNQPTHDDLDFTRRPAWQTILGTACLGLSFVLCAVWFRESEALQTPWLWVSLVLAFWLLTLAAIDLDRYLLPDWLTLPLIPLGILASYQMELGLIESLAGAVIGYLLIFGIGWFWRSRFGREGIGLGDAKLLSAIGAWCGIFALPLVLLVASSTAILLIVGVSAGAKKVQDRMIIPFGPFLSLGFWVGWLAPIMSV